MPFLKSRTTQCQPHTQAGNPEQTRPRDGKPSRYKADDELLAFLRRRNQGETMPGGSAQGRKGDPYLMGAWPFHSRFTRLLERGVHSFIISALLGHSTPTAGFGVGSRITSGYAHATWGAMRSAVDSLEEPVQLKQNWDRGKIVANAQEARKAG